MSTSKRRSNDDFHDDFGLTDHEGRCLLEAGRRNYDERLGKLRREYEAVSREVASMRAELVAALDEGRGND